MSQLLQFYKAFQQSRAPAPKAAPTFEDLTIDEHLNEQQKLIRYVKSTIALQRLVHVKLIADISKSIGFDETVANIVPLLDPLAKDTEPVVKQHLVEQIKILAKFFYADGGEIGYKLILTKLLPITALLLEDSKLEVRQSASKTLVEVSELIKMDDIGQYVLTIILRLAHEDDKEEMRMVAAELLNLVAESMGQDLCKQFIIPEVVSLAEDPAFRVRKCVALNFDKVCKVGGEHELLERLMPAFVRLSKDDMYRVRRACADRLADISKNVSEDIRLGVLVEIFLRLTHDPSKMVKQSVLQQSGMFIATLPARSVNETILGQFCSMINNPTGDLGVDVELKHVCAYSFPAVLQIIGRNRWKEVREVYHNLVTSRSVNIKQTLAYSLHEIARILDNQALVEDELLSVFEDMLQDVEAVQMGVIKHLALFLATLPGPCRVSYLSLLHDILHTTNPFNWRLRQSLAIQLPALILLPPRDDLFRTLFRLVMILLQDPVATVRIESFPGVSAMINRIYVFTQFSISDYIASTPTSDSAPNTPVTSTERVNSLQEDPTEQQFEDYRKFIEQSYQNLDEITRSINGFYISDKCFHRLLWIELARHLLVDLPREYFEMHFIQGILTLTSDPVCNVRVALSALLTGWDTEFATHSSVADQDNDTPEDTKKVSHNYLAPWIEVSSNQSTADIQLISPWHWLLRRKDIQKCIERLSIDDYDVFINLCKVKPMFPHLEFKAISCRGRKTAPGGDEPIELLAQDTMTIQNLSTLSDRLSERTQEGSVGNATIESSICDSKEATISSIISPIEISTVDVNIMKESISRIRGASLDDEMDEMLNSNGDTIKSVKLIDGSSDGLYHSNEVLHDGSSPVIVNDVQEDGSERKDGDEKKLIKRLSKPRSMKLAVVEAEIEASVTAEESVYAMMEASTSFSSSGSEGEEESPLPGNLSSPTAYAVNRSRSNSSLNNVAAMGRRKSTSGVPEAFLRTSQDYDDDEDEFDNDNKIVENNAAVEVKPDQLVVTDEVNSTLSVDDDTHEGSDRKDVDPMDEGLSDSLVE